MRELFRAALVIARRDFAATVFSRTFIFFLVAPLFPLVVMLIFGSLTMNAARQAQDNRIVAVIADQQEFAALSAARDRLEQAFPRARLIRIRRFDPQQDIDAQRQRLLGSSDPPVIGVLEGGLESPRLSTMLPPPEPTRRQLQLLVDQARTIPSAKGPVELSVAQCPAGAAPVTGPQRVATAQGAQAVLFVLTILLATMLLSQLIEEKANKIIEVLAAAVPVSSVFLGKLLAMLAVSVLGVFVWAGAAAAVAATFAIQAPPPIPVPAVGWPVFLFLGLVYFAMSYLLLGAIFIGVGAHASTAREVQTLSMPVTMSQIVVFAVAALAVGDPNSTGGLAAAVFPLSSPYVMIARAAQLPELWPHVVAVVWQLLWVGVILHIAARLFRRSVLKSGPSGRRRPARA